MDQEVQGAMKKQVPAILYRNNPRFTFPTQEQLTSYQVKDVRDWMDAQKKNNNMESFSVRCKISIFITK